MRLAGDYLDTHTAAQVHPADSDTSSVAAEAARWQQVAAQVLQPAIQHASPLLRAAAQAVIGALSPAVLAVLPPAALQQLLAWCCDSVAADEASPVRAAAAKAAGAMAGAPALCKLPQGGHENCVRQRAWLTNAVCMRRRVQGSAYHSESITPSNCCRGERAAVGAVGRQPRCRAGCALARSRIAGCHVQHAQR